MKACRFAKRMSIVSACAIVSFVASATTWFDAGIAGYDSWPTDGGNKVVDGVGTWTNTTDTVYEEDNRIKVYKNIDESLDFDLAQHLQKDIASNEIHAVATIRFPAAYYVPAPVQDAKGAICAVISEETSTTNYLGLVKDAEGATNVWVRLDGATPDGSKDCKVEISTRVESGKVLVQYKVDDTPLAIGGNDWNEIAVDGTVVSRIGFAGGGEVAKLEGVSEVTGPVTVTLPDMENVTIVSVKKDDETLEPTDGKYTVVAGTYVTVTFSTEPGYALPYASKIYYISDNTVIDASEMPHAVNVAESIKINEVMASNGDSLATVNGGVELDWVELRNDSDYDADLTGWYINDSDGKAPKAANQILGSCVVPAHGFKIVWCDKNYTNWAEGEAHAAIGIGKSGGTMILADAPSVDAIRTRMVLPAQMKDVSYGLGRRETTILSALDPAQYRVGSGEWKNCEGPVGMPGATNGFTVTMYKLADATTVNVPAVAAAVASGKYSQKVVNGNVQTIAYKGSSGSYAPEFTYASMSDLGAPGTYFALVVEGVIDIPRAGDWTFCVGSDDGFTLDVFNAKHSFQSEFTGTRGYGQTPAIFKIQEAGAYNVRLVYLQRTGGASLDFCVKEGAFEDFENFSMDGFHLVGSPESGVLHAGAWEGSATVDVSGDFAGSAAPLEWKATVALAEALAATDTCRLKIKHSDGFTATVNGTVVTNFPAGKRTLAEAASQTVVEFPGSLLAAGDNTIEISSANAGGTAFLLGAEVSVTKAEEELVYFREPTPNVANTTAGYGPATPKVAFSVPHGWKTEPVSVALSCAEAPAAQIYYTLDGTSPTASSTPYTGPIAVSSTTCIRAAIPQEGAVIQQDASATYLYLDDVLAQERGVVPAGFPTKDGNGNYPNSQKMIYGMDQNVVNGADRERLLNGFTNSIATMSIVIDPHNMFDNVEGIYVNAVACDGREWERLTMVEQIDPKDDPANPTNDFSTAAGIRIRGAFSRGKNYPKHSLRLFFRNDYGDGNLEFPLFGSEGAKKFKKVDLRTSQNYAWANEGTTDTFVHEVFSRDAQRDMGDYYTRSRYYNLFINGHYWGIYQTEERGDEDYAETYNGGDADNYDVIKTSQPGYVTGASEGTIDAWYALWDMAVNEGFSGAYEANYKKAMGLNPDGLRNPEYPVYLNPTNLMDYMICAHYVVDYDSPAASSKANNLYAVRDRNDEDDGLKSQGFYYLRHDAEHSMGANTSNSKYSQDPTLRGTEAGNKVFKNADAFNPAELNYKLLDNPEYKMAFADRFYKHCLAEGGVFTVEKSTERFRNRMAEIDDAVVCEAARWSTKGQNRQTWLNACAVSLTFITNRMPYMLSQYRKRGWYPSVDAPAAFDTEGNRIADGTALPAGASVRLMDSVGGTNYLSGTIYYTLDGTDPRLEGGAVAEGANACPAEGFTLPQGGATVNARYRSASGEWSALDSIAVRQAVPQSEVKDGLRLAEALTAAVGGDDTLDYLVVTNVAAGEMQLGGVKIVAWNAKKNTEAKPSLTYFFPAGASLPQGGSLKIEASAFAAGEKLTNSQVGLRIYDASGTLVQDVYLDAGWWNGACDETGEHFIAKTFGAEAKARADWKPSATTLGDRLRVLEMYTSTTGGGDTGEFVVLTNLDASAALDLSDVRIVAWNSKKKSEAEPSLTIALDDATIPAGGTLTLDQATYFGGGKLTNSKVGLKIYDPAEACAQEVEVDASWWDGKCDGTGAYFLALEFGDTVNAVSQWTYVEPAPADWPVDPDTEITNDTTPADLGITSGAFTNATTETLVKLSKWAKANSVAFGGEDVNGMSFDASGNPAGMGELKVLEEAYLLNCAVSEVEEKKEEFKFDIIIPGTVPTIDEVDGNGKPLYNGTIKIFGSTTLENGGTWFEVTSGNPGSAKFFKAVLTL